MRRASIVLPKPGNTCPTPPAEAAGVQHTEIVVFEEPRAEHRDEWADRMNRQNEGPLCMCGCGQRVKARAKHRTVGLPRYVHGHHPNPLRRGYERLRAKGYRMVGEVAATLGVSRTTLRRMEAAGVIPRAKRLTVAGRRDVRVYTAVQVAAIVRSWREARTGRRAP